eukprot:14700998-Ditylum_brightwellii.AAC.2
MNIRNKDDHLDNKDPDPNKKDGDPDVKPDFKTGVAQHDNQFSDIPLNYHETQDDDNKTEKTG